MFLLVCYEDVVEDELLKMHAIRLVKVIDQCRVIVLRVHVAELQRLAVSAIHFYELEYKVHREELGILDNKFAGIVLAEVLRRDERPSVVFLRLRKGWLDELGDEDVHSALAFDLVDHLGVHILVAREIHLLQQYVLFADTDDFLRICIV